MNHLPFETSLRTRRAWLAWPAALALCAFAFSALNSAHAQTESETPAGRPLMFPPPPPVEPNGQDTHRWLDSQASRKQASTTRQTLSGPVMEKVHERYVNSFTNPVPQRLRDNTGAGGK